MPAMGVATGTGGTVPLSEFMRQGQMNMSSMPVGGSAPAGGHGGGAGGAVLPPEDMFARMLQGISAQLFGQQPNAGSISQFLSTLGQDYTITPGEGVLTDLFNCVAQHLAFTDLMMIFIGQPSPLERLRLPLQSFLRDSVLRGQETTPAGITATLDRLLQDMAADIHTAAASTRAREGIDLEATITSFIRTTLQEILQLVIEATPDSGFAQRLYDRLRQSVHECVALSRVSLEGGVTSLDTILQDRLRVIASDVNPAMQSWMTQMSLSQLHHIVPSVTLTDDAVSRYVVRRTPVTEHVTTERSPQSSESLESYASVGSNPTEEEMRCEESVHSGDNSSAPFIPIETLSCTDDSSQPIRARLSDDSSQPVRPRLSAAVLARVPPPVKRDAEPQVEVIVGSEDWHAAVPPEWVPVISQDVSRQRREQTEDKAQHNTAQLSDAYIAAMPSKRRKMMSRERHEQFGDVRSHMSQTVRHAAQVTHITPTTSLNALTRDVADDLDLCEAFRGEVGVAIRRRIGEDPDYSPDKYPATEEYFNDK